ncbi:unnamed protein product [Chondrus crispus]|uniref:Uncharacterized protein n=1 Tax=Chondrus crispus TaxID=2769 RepID=R7QAN5_CHOCR|nr:unnamed protein product [Chondrus crispus]CDF34863.1 unnamed protein product [Chondrus crispus]|eukprot:XP_005714682.1 unnamed protein product [Chondrus crispus]
MPFRDFIVLDAIFENGDGALQRRVTSANCFPTDVTTDCASLLFSTDASGGSIALLPTGTVWFISAMKSPTSWSLVSLSGDTVATATKLRRSNFLVQQNNLVVLMVPGDQPESFACWTSGDASARRGPRAKTTAASADVLLANIRIESKTAEAHRLTYDPARGSAIPLFCLWVAEFQRLRRKGLVKRTRCLLAPLQKS